MKLLLRCALAALVFAGFPCTSTQAQNATFNTFYSGIGGGTLNSISTGAYTWIGGGLYNQIYSNNSGTISGGYSNVIVVGNWATIGGGAQNLANADFATVAGGQANVARGTNATVGGGFGNSALSANATVAGGTGNTAKATNATVGGGTNNQALGPGGTIGGGAANALSAIAEGCTIGGGTGNSIFGDYGTIPGGYLNRATNFSLAAGFSAYATNTQSFVWSGASGGAVSTNTNSFTVRAPGGSRFISTATGDTGVILVAGGTSWAVLSDSNAKTDIEPVNTREVLQKVAALPVTSWHYKHDLKRRYIGPMAQDFHAAFGLGSDDKTITTLDTDGVTLAAIKGLVEELKERDAEIAGLKARNSQIEGQLREINQRLDRLPPAP